MYYIYCYTNKVNEKKYIGQTNNINRRYREHLSVSNNEKSLDHDFPIHRAIRKYGIENFSLTILEEINDDNKEFVDEREKYWINFHDTYIKNNKGYNLTLGGQSKKGWSSRFSKEEIDEIKRLIKNGTKYETIKQEFDLSSTFLSNINYGLYFKNEEETYPLYNYQFLEKDIIDLLIQYLKNTFVSFKEIANILNISESTVKKINYGKLRKGMVKEYPIRKISKTEFVFYQIKYLLQKTTLSYKEIAKDVGASDETVRRINLGITHYNSNEKYPLRENIVETISG